MRRRTKIILIILLAAVTSSGCWDREELDTLGIVAGLAIDIDEKDPDKVQITAQVLNPRAISPSQSGGGGGTEAVPVLNRQASGYTLFDAIRKSTTQPSRKLYFPHNQILVVSEELARTKGTEYFLDFFLRDPEPRRSTWILVANNKASDILGIHAVIDEIPAIAIAETLKTWTATSQVFPVSVHMFTQDLMSKSSAPIATYITRIGDDVRLAGMAVFKGTRLVGLLDLAETRGLLWVRNQVKSGIIVTKCIKDGKKVSLEVMNSKCKVTPVMRNGEIYMKIDVEIKSNLGDQQCLHNHTTEEALKSLASQQNTVVENEIKAVLAKAHSLGADILLFADTIYRKYPKKWKELAPNWDKVFPTIKTEINVKSSINHIGMIVEPARPPQQDK